MAALSNGPRIMQESHSVDLHLYKAIVLSSNSCQTHVVPKAALFPRMVALLKAKTILWRIKVVPMEASWRNSGLNNV